eukprot:SAG22_NODE_7987_length_693_cov_0.880471_1_plen_65_part_10
MHTITERIVAGPNAQASHTWHRLYGTPFTLVQNIAAKTSQMVERGFVGARGPVGHELARSWLFRR